MATHVRRRGITALTVSSAKSLRRRLAGFLQSSSAFRGKMGWALPCLRQCCPSRLNARVERDDGWLSPFRWDSSISRSVPSMNCGPRPKLVIRKELR